MRSFHVLRLYIESMWATVVRGCDAAKSFSVVAVTVGYLDGVSGVWGLLQTARTFFSFLFNVKLIHKQELRMCPNLELADCRRLQICQRILLKASSPLLWKSKCSISLSLSVKLWPGQIGKPQTGYCPVDWTKFEECCSRSVSDFALPNTEQSGNTEVITEVSPASFFRIGSRVTAAASSVVEHYSV